MTEPVTLRLGVKTDPIEYRFSHEWLFRLMAEEGVRHAQLGTHFELYQLPDEYFDRLKKTAGDAGVEIDSLFTAHRELGGFFREEPGYEAVARRSFERCIRIGALLGAKSVGANPGAVLRDRMGFKDQGIARYLRHMKELMHLARECGVEWLTIEPMSCLAEPPALPGEIEAMGSELAEYHRQHPDDTARIGYCADTSHGYVERSGKVAHDYVESFEAALPHLHEIHLKNTDASYLSTFGFGDEERRRGIVDVPRLRRLLFERADRLPAREIAGYLEIDGPKRGRDHSDHLLEDSLRQSLRYLKKAFLEGDGDAPPRRGRQSPRAAGKPGAERTVLVAPSMMCADPLNFEADLRRVEQLGADMLHIDIMDAHFVPNMPMGLGVLERLRAKTHLPIDVHLMVADNDFFIERIRDMGVSRISVHVESCARLDRTLARIREIGAQAGAAINPATPLDSIADVLERLDHVLVMTVNPGYAGQKMAPGSIRKIADCRRLLDDRGCERLPIQVDGNVSFENIPAMVASGAANLVAGSSSFFHKSAPMSENMERIHRAIQEGLAATR